MSQPTKYHHTVLFFEVNLPSCTARSRLEDETACAYDFGWHDFHASGHGHFDGGLLRSACIDQPDLSLWVMVPGPRWTLVG